MTDQRNLRFYLTEAQPCPYLPQRMERKVFTPLRGGGAANLNDTLSVNGFRRSQNVAYRPQCPGCNACVATRVVATEFQASRSDRRTLNRNKALRRIVRPSLATEEQYQLFRKYLGSRHAEGAMADMDALDFASMVEDSTVRTQVVEYHDMDEDGEPVLVAACLTDVMADGVSLVYSFFDPDRQRDSLGNFIILDHIDLATALGLSYVYLGYWVDGCRKMAYKTRFTPTETLIGNQWTRVTERDVNDI
jgi:arginine-tRNA-protein transferase